MAGVGALVGKASFEGQTPKGLLASHLPCTLDLTGGGGALSISLFSTLGFCLRCPYPSSPSPNLVSYPWMNLLVRRRDSGTEGTYSKNHWPK